MKCPRRKSSEGSEVADEAEMKCPRGEKEG